MLLGYFWEEVLVDVELLSVLEVPVEFFLTFFLWTFLVLVPLVSVLEVWLEVCDVFWAFFAAVGAAIRKGTAATVKSVDVNSFFIFFSLVVAG